MPAGITRVLDEDLFKRAAASLQCSNAARLRVEVIGRNAPHTRVLPDDQIRASGRAHPEIAKGLAPAKSIRDRLTSLRLCVSRTQSWHEQMFAYAQDGFNDPTRTDGTGERGLEPKRPPAPKAGVLASYTTPQAQQRDGSTAREYAGTRCPAT